ncbi:MAG: TraR/DksA family transcriptional regulator [Bacteroidetes bacterium]|nr:MAG: TraR/DksA family transcriptional regulator [Bacteroidota bacterium]
MSTQEEKTRYSDEELEEFRQLIESRLKDAREDLAWYESQLQELAENPDAKARGYDHIAGVEEVEQLTTLAARQRKLIKHLENALVRIDNKVYGICRVTGKLIPKERLRAVPHATLSVEAKLQRR